jgi:hypothetical protein
LPGFVVGAVAEDVVGGSATSAAAPVVGGCVGAVEAGSTVPVEANITIAPVSDTGALPFTAISG